MDFYLILRTLQRRLWVLIVFPLIAVACAVFFVLRMDKIYSSYAHLATGFTADDAVRLNDQSSNSFEVNTRFTNVIESMHSMPVLSLVSCQLMLHDLENETPFRKIEDNKTLDFPLTESFLTKAKEALKKHAAEAKPINTSDPFGYQLYELLKAYGYDNESLSENFSIKRLTTSDFISVDFSSENPFLSAMAVNTLCQEFIRYNKVLKGDRSSESIDFLENLVRDKKRVLDEKEAMLNDFKVNNNVFNYGAESESKIAQITEYELNKEREEKNINALRLSLAQLNEKIQSGSSLNQQEVIQINQRIIDLRRRITDITNTGTEAEKATLGRLRDELQLEISRLDFLNQSKAQDQLVDLTKERDKVKLDLEIAQSNLASADLALRRLKYDVSGFATKEAKISELQRDVQVASDEYLDAQDKLNSSRNKALVVGSSLRQILEAQPSLEPEPSKGILIVALAGIGSFVICVVVLLLIEFADMSIRIPIRLERLTGLSTIGSLNQIKIKGFDLRKTFAAKATDRESTTFVHFLRKLRYEIQKSDKKVFLISSTQPYVGKSFIIICLSYTLSLVNKKILIIDTNFKRNSLTKLLLPAPDNRKLLKRGVDEKALLLNGKNGEAQDTSSTNGSSDTPSEDSHNIIYKTEFKGVDIIGNIGGTDSPSEILAGRDFKEMIANLSEQYDYIFLEGPSINEYSDSKELIEYVDKVIAVFDANTNLNPLDKESITYLKSIKEKYLGSVLNKVQLKDLSA
jgi:polysaccharide biosynthesis transport protein